MLKGLFKKTVTAILSLALLFSITAAALPSDDRALTADAASDYVCLGYVADWMFDSQNQLAQNIDFKKLTHVNFAFSLVDSNSLLPTVASPAKLQAVVNEIKAQGADTKVMLSIGGWGAGNFCEACNSDSRREAFANECLNLVNTYGLAGIDIDWEYPGSGDAGISYCSNCKTDYTKLCQAIRDKIGSDKLLTMAGGASSYRASQLECSKLAGILDFVNLMNYDYNETNHASFSTTKTAAQAWVNAGFTKKQINIGLPFYGRSTNSTYNWLNYNEFLPKYILTNQATVTTADDESYAMINGAKYSFDTPEQIRKKILWLKTEGYGGAMTWELLQDYNQDLLSTMYSNLNGDGTYNSPYIPIPGLDENTGGGGTDNPGGDVETGVGEGTTTFPNGATVAEITSHANYYGEFQTRPFEYNGTYINSYPVGALVYYNGAYYENYAVSSAWDDGWEPDVHPNWHRILILEDETGGEETDDPVHMFNVLRIGNATVYNNFYGVYTVDRAPIIKNYKAFVPLRNATQLIYADIQDYNENDEFFVVFTNYKVKMQINNTAISFHTLDGTLVESSSLPADQVPIIEGGKAYLPARALADIASMDGERHIDYFDESSSGGLGEFIVYTMGETATTAELLAVLQTASNQIGY